jgi:opacity protein-like surface antigen
MQKWKLKTLALTFITSALSLNCYAAGPGFYMGVALGPATNNGSPQKAQLFNSPLKTTVNPRSKQFGSRLYVGDQFNNYAAFELGFTFFNSISYSNPGNFNLCSSPKVRVRDIEILAKGILPFYTYFDIFGKAGIAVTYTSVTGSLNPTFNPRKQQFCGKSKYTTKYDPSLAVGVTYNITQGWTTDATYQMLLTGGPPGRMTFYSIGLAYHWTPRYCGQFLCDD